MKFNLHSVQTRLNGAFALVALVGVAAALAGVIALQSTRGALSEVVDEAAPMASAAGALEAASSATTGELAAFARSVDTVDMAASEARLQTLYNNASVAVSALSQAGLDDARAGNLTALLDDLAAGIEAANAPTAANLEARNARLDAISFAISDRVSAVTALEEALENASGQAELETFLRLMIDLNLILTQYAELDGALSVDEVANVEDRFELAMDELLVNLAILGGAATQEITDASEALISRGEGPQGVFALRRTEIESEIVAANAVEDARIAHALLAAEVEQLVSEANALADSARANGFTAVLSGQILLIVMAIGAVVIAGVIGWIYVNNNLLNRLTRISRTTTALASGDTGQALNDEGQDEIADMARAVAILRENEIERVRLASESEAERAAREKRTRAIEALVQEFESTSGRALEAVSRAAGEMEMAANALTESSHSAAGQTAEVNEAGVLAAQNVDTVAAAAEEMTSSIAEIAQQISRSSTIARSAADEVSGASADVTALSEAAGRIDGVVRLINEIAEKTNLLALNATIEAARAGEAGKGFAVVASEVKTLAEQTARATGSISEQVNGIQSATGKAVSAITAIGTVIREMNEISTAIAAAMEEQRAAAEEITRSAQEAAGGTRRVSQAIQGVDAAASETGQCAAQVNEASHGLTQEAGTLRSAVARFLEGVRAA
ncbi:methyl-accepting chemotaxis protein [Glycocaulis albus]|uniref:Methyl-accepting chemotaxis protein n=1 Tax=Glycocaulis albus TaxID=1382801 RepID=A0ABQ1XPS3_9PROT|nr:methyl-accepting chemotaxis protein [Glycocaulis albus]GGG99792.1 methyl-accepting chemotaxis protein [Glycocaulis albus]